MRRSALLFGAPYGSLKHVDASLARLRTTFDRYQFDDIVVHGEAPRERLLVELDRWIDSLLPGDAAVLVYIGHGGLRRGIGHLQPSGFAERHTRGFRGVLALELGQRLVCLAQRTANATVILDCCHAGAVVEDPSHLDARALQRLVAAQAQRLRPNDGLELAAPSHPSLGSIVQLAAAAASQTAMEDRTRRVGLFTGQLADVLDMCRGLDVPWSEVLAEVRLRVTALYPTQSPVISGPARRIPFTDTEVPPRRYDFACRWERGALLADAGELDGVARGDRFRVRRLGFEAATSAPLACVTEVNLQRALLQLEAAPPLDGPVRIERVVDEAEVAREGWGLVQNAGVAAGALLPDSYDVRWGLIDAHGQPCGRLPAEGVVLAPNDDVWIAFGARQNRLTSEMYFALFHVDIEGGMRPLCPLRNHGVVLPIGRHWLVASRLAGPLAGADTLAWSKGQALRPGQHALLIVVSDGPIDVRTLEVAALEQFGSPHQSRYALHCLRFTVHGSVAAPIESGPA